MLGMADAFFVPGVIRVFLCLFLWDLGDEPYGREQNQGDHCRDWRRYHKIADCLKGVNTEIRNTQSQLKDVEKLLKLDPGNTELIAQKHRLLAQAVSETREKLETLKTAQQQADEALRNGTISQDQYDALQREIIGDGTETAESGRAGEPVCDCPAENRGNR